MELHDWLLSSRLITLEQYKKIVSAQISGSISGARFDNDGRVEYGPNDDATSVLIRKHPIGDVIDNLSLKSEVYQRAKVADLAGLVRQWQQWHVDNIEPISTYSTSSRVGRNLYRRQEEKRLVARFVAQARVRTGSLIQNSDTVVLPEGSSAFYVGLAIAALKKKVSIVTSNTLLCREYLDNPALAKAFKDFYMIGGLVDRDMEHMQSEHGGVFGPDAERGYETAIRESPTATVVVMPVSGLLPDDGPYATEEFIRKLKYAIIRSALDGEKKVREFVFIADYSKHLLREADEYGAPIVEREEWRKLLAQNKGRFSLVTVPPKNMRSALAASERPHPVMRSLDAIKTAKPFDETDRAYCRTSSELAKLFNDGGSKLTFHEAITDGDEVPKAERASVAIA